MKLTAFILLMACLQVSANGYSQRISLAESNAPLDKVLREIQRQTGYTFIYTETLLKQAKTVTIMVTNVSLDQALDKCFLNQPITYEILEKTIIIKPREGAGSKEAGPPPSIDITGRVTNGNGEPLEGATIAVKGTASSVMSGADGHFTIPAKSGDILIISYIGYQTQYKKLADAGNRILVIRLLPTTSVLDEVVIGSNVISTKRKAEIAAVTVIDTKTIERSPYQTIDQLLRGFVPGSNATDYGPGNNNVSPFVSIRGATTTTGQGNIKVYIDGVEMAANTTFLSSIDKNMIDRIEVARGAAASTLYGSGANGGVIQIFTKKGKQNQSKLVLSVAAGPLESDYTKKNGQLISSVNYSGSANNASYFLGSQYRRVTDIVPDADENALALNGGTRINFGKLSLDLTMQYSSRKQGAPTNPVLTKLFEEHKYPVANNIDKREDLMVNQLFGANLNYRLFDWWNHTLIMGMNKQITTYWSTVPTADYYAYSSGEYTTPSVRYFSNFILPGAGTFKSTFTAGFEYARPEYALVIGNTTRKKGQGVFGPGQYNSHNINDNYGYFAQWQPQLGEHFFLTAGVRVEKNELFGPEYGWNGKAVSPRIGATGNFTLGPVIIKPRISYGKGITAPSYLQRFGQVSASSVIQPNEDLAPTSQTGFDYGLELFAFNNKVSLEATYYDQKVQDLITTNNMGPDSAGIIQIQYVNLQSVKNKGYEFAANGQWDQWTVRGTFSIVNSRALELGPQYTGYLKADSRIMNVAHHLAGFSVNYDFMRAKDNRRIASANLSMNYMSGVRSTDYIDFYTQRYGNGATVSIQNFIITYPSVMKFHFSGEYAPAKNIMLSLQVRNLTDNKRFEVSNYYPMQGRSWLIGVSYTL